MTAPPSGSRETWIDTAKGALILLVVLTHSTLEFHQAGIALPGWVDAVDSALAELRMPAFFAASGLFAARSVTAPWRRFGRDKVARFGYLYLLWSVLWLLGLAVRATLTGQPVGAELSEPALGVLIVGDRLWYLVALPVFFTVARVCRRVPVAVQLAAAGVLSVLFAVDVLAVPGAWGPDKMPQYLVWFLVGCHFGTVIRAGVARARWWVPVVLACAWVAGMVTLPRAVALAVLPVVTIPLTFTACAHLSGPLGRGLAWLGERTLPVYVLHSGALIVVVAAVAAVPLTEVAATVALPVVALAAAGLSVLVQLALQRVPGLFALPRPRRPGLHAARV